MFFIYTATCSLGSSRLRAEASERGGDLLGLSDNVDASNDLLKNVGGDGNHGKPAVVHLLQPVAGLDVLGGAVVQVQGVEAKIAGLAVSEATLEAKVLDSSCVKKGSVKTREMHVLIEKHATGRRVHVMHLNEKFQPEYSGV